MKWTGCWLSESWGCWFIPPSSKFGEIPSFQKTNAPCQKQKNPGHVECCYPTKKKRCFTRYSPVCLLTPQNNPGCVFWVVVSTSQIEKYIVVIKLDKSSPNRAALFSLKVLQTKIIKTTFKFIYMVSGTFNPSGLDKKVIISSSWTSQAPLPPVLKRPKTKKQRKKQQKNQTRLQQDTRLWRRCRQGSGCPGFGCCFVRMPQKNKLYICANGSNLPWFP